MELLLTVIAVSVFVLAVAFGATYLLDRSLNKDRT
jgi:hypothetical protein